MSRRPGLAAFLALLLATSGPAFGWGARGHRIATRVAWERLTPEAKKGVEDLLNKGDSLVDVCNWADHEGHDVEKASGPWHYVNVPISEEKYSEKFCPKGGCVVSKIEHYRKALADPKTSRKDSQLALLFLVHFVEDLHQPLHVGDNRDRGGNQTQVQFFGQGSNLHRVWDTSILDRVKESDKQWADDLIRLAAEPKAKGWSGGSVEDWATESLVAAKKAYGFPGGSRPLESGARLGESYEEFALPIVRERLAQAGVRLADELNAIFDEKAAKGSSPARRAAAARP